MPTKTPTSSLSAIELLALRAWYRGRARITQLFSTDRPPEALIARPFAAAKLPLEIVEMIIAHLIHDTRSLLACSLTCYSWYIASVPHLHHTLVVRPAPWATPLKRDWPKPLEDAGKLGLLPFVKKFQIHSVFSIPDLVSPKQFNSRILPQIPGLINIRELEIDGLDVPSFMPKVRRYFGHFLPMLRSLSLRKPKGTDRQLIFFIGLFEHLEDLTLFDVTVDFGNHEPEDDTTLVPPFAPPLRGRLVVERFTRAGLLKDMSDLFGGIRCRSMALFDVRGTQLLLNASAETLETLRLYPTDPFDPDLSLHGSLRTFEIGARFIASKHEPHAPSSVVSNFLGIVLSTIKSSTLELVVVFRDYDFCGLTHILRRAPDVGGSVTPAQSANEGSWHRSLFRLFREMYAVREFQLVLCADVCGSVGEYAVGVLKRAVAAEKAAKRLDHSPLEPLVIYNPRDSPERAYRGVAT